MEQDIFAYRKFTWSCSLKDLDLSLDTDAWFDFGDHVELINCSVSLLITMMTSLAAITVLT